MPRGEARRTQDFDSYYGALYGAERWANMKKAMMEPQPRVAVWNRWCKLSMAELQGELEVVQTDCGLKVLRLPASACMDSEIPNAPRDEEKRAAYHIADMSAVLCIEALALEAHHKVLDLCAAPGGKALAAAQFLTQAGGHIVMNDNAPDRCRRLRRLMEDVLPEELSSHALTQRDATRWHQPLAFDAIIVDPPCSSERHLVQKHNGLVGWSKKVTDVNAEAQQLLLLRAIETAKIGGKVLYTTTALSPVENDGIVEAALRKSRCGVELVPITGLSIEGAATPVGGIHILPDVHPDVGPLYLCMLRRTAEHRPLSDSDDSDSDDSDDSDDDTDDDDE